jgi:hypothetical protein
MKKLLSTLGGAAVFLSLGVSAPAQAGSPFTPATVATAATTSAAAASTFSMRRQFAREVVRYGQSDRGVYHIAHVRELQYRLRWAGVFSVGVTGNFGDITRAAVKRYQRREGLTPRGVANHVTWAHLLRDTVRHRSAVPEVCRRDGWHACYDRSMHQVVLLRNGNLVNTWLVRGGASSTPTRRGTHAVYYRDRDHVSGMFGSPMPYSQFFDGGEALHGSRDMTDPFYGHSHGCVNMYVEDARQLWRLTNGKRLMVTVYGAWD